MIIGISGKMQAGKDTAGEILQKLYPTYNFEIIKFAGKVKEIACLLIGCTMKDLESEEFKDAPLGEEWNYFETFNIRRNIYFSREDIPFKSDHIPEKRMTPRILMQLIGTNCGRDIIHPNVWVNATMSSYNSSTSNWLITDVRFPNEANVVLSNGGVLLRIERDVELRLPKIWDEYDKSPHLEWDSFLKARDYYDKVYHRSETSLDDFTSWDGLIYNNTSINYLTKELRLFIHRMHSQRRITN